MDLQLILDLRQLDKSVRESFGKYIIEQIKYKIKQDYNKERAINIQNYINDSDIINWKGNKRIFNIYDILLYACDVLNLLEEDDGKYLIEIDNNAVFPGTYDKVLSFIQLITFGSLSVRSYPIFSDTLEFIANNLNSYYTKYMLGV